MQKFIRVDESESILSFKKVIDHLRKNASAAFVSVREKKLSELLDDCLVNYNYRGAIYDYLKEKGLLIVQGERALMRYKFVESLMKVDSLTLASQAYQEIASRIKPARKRIAKNKIPDEKVNLPVSFISTKEFSLKDIVVFIRDNQVLQAQIVSCFFPCTLDGPADEFPVFELNYPNIRYDLVITTYGPEKGKLIRNVSKSEIFSSVDILFQAMKIRYNNSIAIVKTEPVSC